ncbi:E3 ubiquitin-protein ligase MIB2-like isoform X1 [Varroa jacobsoni]|uniref:E3 ubiquitin-protein ligase MIB2-like isoform X1 n=1 Tax=Varroa jacobsoni TaxID=62625 RepID=UPI000BF3173C|nr:E3 ubiquitin-protein ligase MIB2-like isoform X1 [Varroa jacobsoni]XP_022698617.1 E3 ubiquitin-protein ligase MIB2-like isoform X1 [Varroa jacobsoni]XP_022698618.1 E3 ubiquitin-protein ligase MIB2-like isoform X1 [Varroa jacobsoni]XP_022698619.1 E3 ubiquitin-protein ligase MIB2-like isoform X1 [Varroa jacobsoni]
MMLEVGLRVVRGPDWKWGQQDDGEGHLGTVVEIGKAGNPHSPEKTVVVQWDSGGRTNYRAGYEKSFDLRVFDNAPVGVKHPNIVCNACGCQGIAGMRWKCSHRSCYDFDLCSHCYHDDQHDLTHPFTRFETPNSDGVAVGPRAPLPGPTGSPTHHPLRIPASGIFKGAKVVRGHDWDWGNQDGGEGKLGDVANVLGWEQESGRSVANVTWACGSMNVYRVGHKGKVDLQYVTAAPGGFYYREHLPVLGVMPAGAAGGGPIVPISRSNQPPRFSVGEHVKVQVDLETLKALQNGHGGWNPRMADCVGKVGKVHRVTERGDIRVQLEGHNTRWTFHPDALTKWLVLAVGDFVRLIDDLPRFRELQIGHGEYCDTMASALGRLGKVTRLYVDGDLRVLVGAYTWTLNRQCVVAVPGSQTEINNTMRAHTREGPQNPLISPFLTAMTATTALTTTSCTTSSRTTAATTATTPTATTGGATSTITATIQSTGGNASVASQQDHQYLVRNAALGLEDAVRDYLTAYPDRVNHKSSSKTALQVTCHQGHLTIVELLLRAKASLESADDDGDTALHYAAFGNQPAVIERLLAAGANINAQNNTKCTPLHVAVNKQFLECVRVLLSYTSALGQHHHGSLRERALNINIQDAYGDTALHDAIGKENEDITDLLMNVAGVDFSLRNRMGFNVLHHASLKGNAFAVEKLLARTRQLVDIKKDDGFAALHLAALNGHVATVELLLDVGRCDPDIRNNRLQTSLLLAVAQGHEAIVERLVAWGASVNAQDEDGDTPLHVALIKRPALMGEAVADPQDAPAMAHIRASIATSVCLPPSAQNGTSAHFQNPPNSTRSQTDIVGRTSESQTTMEDKGLVIACYLAREGSDLYKENHAHRTPLSLADNSEVEELLRFWSTNRDTAVPGVHPSIQFQATVGLHDSEGGSPLVELCDGAKDDRECVATAERAGKDVSGNGESGKDSTSKECEICLEAEAVVRLEPCGHCVTCEECSVRMRKCLSCQQIIVAKTHRVSGMFLSSRQRQSSLERLRQLESRIAEMEESASCSICMERRRNVAFLCGHAACAKCAQPLRTCHMCRKPITKRIQLYL